jgi:hypothetical protein
MTSKRRAGVAAAIAAIAALLLAECYGGSASSAPPAKVAAADTADDQAVLYRACNARLADPRPVNSRQRTWLRDCQNLFSPSPSARPTTAGPSSSPTAGPSASPTGQPTPSTSPSPSASPTASPSPSPTPPAAGCMPQPSACGYPDETNTGVPPGTTLTRITGDWHITAPGVYSGRDVTGCVYVEASGVTIRESRISGNCWFSVRTTGINGSHPGLVIEDTEIVLASTLEGAYGICCSEYILDRVWIHGSPAGNAGADCVYFNTNVVVQNSFCEVGVLPCLGSASCTSAHSDGYTSDGGNNVRLTHNTGRNPNRQTSVILISTNSGSITNTIIEDGLYAGGGYTVYCGTDAGGVDPGTVFRRNRIARDFNGAAEGYWPNGGSFGATTHCAGLGDGNVWDDTGAPLPNTGGAAVRVRGLLP